MTQTLLEVSGLSVEFGTYGGTVKAVRNIDFELARGKTLAIVGESGCGKSTSALAVMGLIPHPLGKITSGSVLLDGKEILGLSLRAANRIRGKDMGMIFQDPLSSLNPTLTVGKQISESLRVHEGLSRKKARERSIQALGEVQITDPERLVDYFPHQLSGGMRQRVMIAIAIACRPKLLIADEPTTALDVTVQAQILALLRTIQTTHGMSILLITHDLAVVSEMADAVAVMYAGQIIETGDVENVMNHSAHPYTMGLKASLPDESRGTQKKLTPIEGSPPDLFQPPEGCPYFERCPKAMKVCQKQLPPFFPAGVDHYSRCWLHHPKAPQ